jgi:DNA-binding transcriptional MocR family regulator
MASPFTAEWATRLLASRHLDRIVAEIRGETQARQALVAAALPAQVLMSHPHAYYFCLKLRNGWTAESYSQAAEAAGIGVTPLSLFEVSALHRDDSVRVCVNAAPDRESLSEGLATLAALLEAGAPRTARVRAAV